MLGEFAGVEVVLALLGRLGDELRLLLRDLSVAS